jgi:hypothetical protein
MLFGCCLLEDVALLEREELALGAHNQIQCGTAQVHASMVARMKLHASALLQLCMQAPGRAAVPCTLWACAWLHAHSI